jgi:hypothetical protein
MESQINNDEELSQKQKDSMLFLYALCGGNPGAYTVVSKIFNIIYIDQSRNDEVLDFIYKLLDKHIVGARLWYIFKNEANKNSDALVQLDLDLFTEEYFYEKFEQFI